MSKQMNINELHKFNGIDSSEIYIACKDTIFDVTNSGKVIIKNFINLKEDTIFLQDMTAL